MKTNKQILKNEGKCEMETNKTTRASKEELEKMVLNCLNQKVLCQDATILKQQADKIKLEVKVSDLIKELVEIKYSIDKALNKEVS